MVRSEQPIFPLLRRYVLCLASCYRVTPLLRYLPVFCRINSQIDYDRMLNPYKTIIFSSNTITSLVFFLGCSEISTAPLIFIDLAKFFPPIEGSAYDTIVSICGPLFALSFTYYRVILWWKVSYGMFQDIFGALNDGTANKLRPGRNHVLYVMMGLNLILGCLQLYWFSIILEEALKVLGISQEASNEL